MSDMDWDRILSALRKGREQLESLRIGSDAGEKKPDDETFPATEAVENPQDHDS